MNIGEAIKESFKRPWTEEEEKLLVKLRLNRRGFDFISKRLLRTPDAVRMKFYTLCPGLNRRNHKGFKNWSRKEELLLEQLHVDGLSRKEIAARLGRTLSSINNRILILDLSTPLGPSKSKLKKLKKEAKLLHEQGLSFRQIARNLKISAASAYRYIRGDYYFRKAKGLLIDKKTASPEVVEKIIQLRNEGVSFDNIAKEVKFSTFTCRRYYKLYLQRKT